MKKLALASVAFAGITAYGAGDSFAAGFVGYTSMTGFSYTDTTVWTPVGATSSGSQGGTASIAGLSAIKHIGVTATFDSPTGSFTPELFIVNQNCLFNTGNAVCGGFAKNTHILGDNSFEGSGSVSLGFNQHLSALGFQLSPIEFADWGATATFYTGTSANLVKLGSVKLSGLPFCSGTSNVTGCHVPAFIGATDTSAPITAATISGSQNLGIGPLYEKLSSSARIPEPATLSVLGAGLLGLGAMRRRRNGRDPAEKTRWSPFGRWRVANSPPDPKQL